MCIPLHSCKVNNRQEIKYKKTCDKSHRYNNIIISEQIILSECLQRLWSSKLSLLLVYSSLLTPADIITITSHYMYTYINTVYSYCMGNVHTYRLQGMTAVRITLSPTLTSLHSSCSTAQCAHNNEHAYTACTYTYYSLITRLSLNSANTQESQGRAVYTYYYEYIPMHNGGLSQNTTLPNTKLCH